MDYETTGLRDYEAIYAPKSRSLEVPCQILHCEDKQLKKEKGEGF